MPPRSIDYNTASSAGGGGLHAADYPVQSSSLLCCFCWPSKPFSRKPKPEQQVGIEIPIRAGRDVAQSFAAASATPTTNFATPTTTSFATNHSSAVATVYDLPPGWKPVPSRSRPDRFAYLNEFTGERISWLPTEPASTIKGEIKRIKKRKSTARRANSVDNGTQGDVVGLGDSGRRASSVDSQGTVTTKTDLKSQTALSL